MIEPVLKFEFFGGKFEFEKQLNKKHCNNLFADERQLEKSRWVMIMKSQ